MKQPSRAELIERFIGGEPLASISDTAEVELRFEFKAQQRMLKGLLDDLSTLSSAFDSVGEDCAQERRVGPAQHYYDGKAHALINASAAVGHLFNLYMAKWMGTVR